MFIIYMHGVHAYVLICRPPRLAQGKAPVVNAAGRVPKHLYILPGGIAEIFVSQPGAMSAGTCSSSIMLCHVIVVM